MITERKNVKMRKHNVTTTGNRREQETKWKTKNEQMRKNHIYIFSQQSAFCEQDLLDNDDNGFWYFDALVF